MKKIIGIIISCMFILIFAVTIYRISENNRLVKNDSLYSEGKKEVQISKIDIEQLHNEYENDIQDLKDGTYSNLVTTNPYIYITDESMLYQISEKSNEKYKNISLLELIEKELDIVKNLIGENINMDNLVDDTSWYYINDKYDLYYPTYQETVESINSNKYKPNEIIAEYCTYPYLAYVGATREDGDGMYCHVPPDMDYVVFMRGKLFQLTGAVLDDLENDLVYKPLRFYYIGQDDLDDEYQLANGKISINDAVEFVETYFANTYPYNMYPDIEQKVHHVSVYDIGNGVHAYEFSLVRKFAGLMAESGSTTGTQNGEVKDQTKVIMVETDKVDMRIGSGNGHEMKKIGEGISEVVSLKNALEIISSKIGNNSKYEINEISMIFRRKINNDILYQEDYTDIPTWLIKCENVVNGMNTSFYVDMENGKLEYVQN